MVFLYQLELTDDVQLGKRLVRIFHRQPRSTGDATEQFAVVDSLEGVVQFARDTHPTIDNASRSRFHNRLGTSEIQFTIT